MWLYDTALPHGATRLGLHALGPHVTRVRTVQAQDLNIGQRVQIDRLEFDVVGVGYKPERRLVTLSLQRDDDSTAVTLRLGADAEVRVVEE